MKKICTVLIALLLPLCAAAQQNWKAVMRYDKQAAKTALSERLTKYAAYDTQADPEADKVPSSKGQTAFAKALAKELKNIEIIIKVKTGEQDKVFGTVSTKQICEELKKKNFDIDKKKIILDHSLDSLGTHIVKIELHKKVIADLKVTLKKQ